MSSLSLSLFALPKTRPQSKKTFNEKKEEKEEGLYLQLETRECVQTNEAKCTRRRAPPT